MLRRFLRVIDKSDAWRAGDEHEETATPSIAPTSMLAAAAADRARKDALVSP